MKTRAPGKVVLSGAYAVLEGAPAIVSAVDRFVIADSSAQAEFETPEFLAAHTDAFQPRYDASALRQGDRKLGLGSSAAILVACLGAARLDSAPQLTDATLQSEVYPRALAAHRQAQGGGSGIDVAASTFGGHLLAQRSPSGDLTLSPQSWPDSLVIEVWAAGRTARTSDLLRAVFDLKRRNNAEYAPLLDAQTQAATRAAHAFARGSARGFVEALADQHTALERLGRAAGVEIVIDAVHQLHALAKTQGGSVLPAGAGGGDISIFAGLRASSTEFRGLAGRLEQNPLDLALGSRGLHRV